MRAFALLRHFSRFDTPIQAQRIVTARWVLLPTLIMALSISTLAVRTAYSLRVVAKTGDIVSGKMLTGFKLPSFGLNSPAINANGGIAFYATYSEGDLVGEGIFMPPSLVLKTGDVVNGHFVHGLGFVPALKDDGTLVVRGLLSTPASAILTSTAVLAKDGDRIGGQTLTDIGPPAINNSGVMAFVGSFSGGTGIFTQKGLLARSGESIAGQPITSFGPPAINDRGTVAFQCWLSGPVTTAILTPTSVLVKTGDTIGGKKLIDLFYSPALNSSDTVAFVGEFTGGTGVFTQKALLVQAGDIIGGQRLTSFRSPVINDAGIVSFLATYSGGEGIFTQSSLIAKTGDAISGRALVDLGPPAISSNGEVAFVGLFSDGSSAVILARPTDPSMTFHASPAGGAFWREFSGMNRPVSRSTWTTGFHP